MLILSLFCGITEGKTLEEKNSKVKESSIYNSELVLPGSTVKLVFRLSDIYVGADSVSVIHVVVCAPGKSPEWLLSLDMKGNTIKMNPKVQGRMTASYDFSNGQIIVRINFVQVEDTGDYYIAVVTKGGRYIWSSGKRLEVSSGFIPLSAEKKEAL